MSLYHESAEVLDKARNGDGSLKSIIFGQKKYKSDSKQLYALSTESAKWSQVLSEVIEQSGILKDERSLSPLLALVLVHDLLLSKKGIALPSNHGINAAVSRHKSRLSAELTKARLRRGCATLENLRTSIAAGPSSADPNYKAYPRWIRVNTLKTTLEEQLGSTFADYGQLEDLAKVAKAPFGTKAIWLDNHVPDLVAIPAHVDVTSNRAYKCGEIILQDKASCFPASLLDPTTGHDIIDACAAPGNKTTHLAALKSYGRKNEAHGSDEQNEGVVYACEKDASRAQTLTRMVKTAGADRLVQSLAKQDFLKLDPNAAKFRNVTALLLDPSCSGSGIVGRDEGALTIYLPTLIAEEPKGKKRKRGNTAPAPTVRTISVGDSNEKEVMEQEATDENTDATRLQERLSSLSAFQLRIIEHAMSFPAARRITYSTCSVHDEENEAVVTEALLSDVAQKRGWRIMAREDQVHGMKSWPRRGKVAAVRCIFEGYDSAGLSRAESDAETIANACIRCEKDTQELTMGFFVAGFVRDPDRPKADQSTANAEGVNDDENRETDEEWNGFDDDDS